MVVNGAEDAAPEVATSIPSGSKQNATPSPYLADNKHNLSPTMTPPTASSSNGLQDVATKPRPSTDRIPSAVARFLDAKKYIQDVGVASEKAATPVSWLASAAPPESAATSVNKTPVVPTTTKVTQATSKGFPLREFLQSLSNNAGSRKPSESGSCEKAAPPVDRAARRSTTERAATAAALDLNQTRAPPPDLYPPHRPPSDPCRNNKQACDATPQHAGTWSDGTMRLEQVESQAVHWAPRQSLAVPPSNPRKEQRHRDAGERPAQVDARTPHHSAAASQSPDRLPRAQAELRKNVEKPHGAAALRHDAAAGLSHSKHESVKTWLDVNRKLMQPGAHPTRLSPTTAGPRTDRAEPPAAGCCDTNPARGPADPCRSRERPCSTPEVGMSRSPRKCVCLCVCVHACVLVFV